MPTNLFGAGFRRNRADSTHSGTGEVLEILLPGESTGTHSRQLHVLQSGDSQLDLNIAAQSNPTLYLHSVTTPITDYLSIGGHDGTTATIDVVGGSTLVLAASGVTQLTMNAIGLVVAESFGVVIGHTSQITTAAVAELQVLGSALADSSMVIGKFTTSNATGPELQFVAGNGTAVGASVIVADDDVLGRIVWHGDDGTDFANVSAYLQMEVDDGSPVANGIGTAFVLFQQIGDDTVAAEEHMRISAKGTVEFNQQAQDIAHFKLASSDLTTGLTTVPLGQDVTTDDYFSISKIAATTGGAHILALAETGAATALHIEAWGGSPATTDTNTSLGIINIFGGEHSGTNDDTDIAANSNLLTIGEINSSGARLTRLLLKAEEGELHVTAATLEALDMGDDIILVRTLQKHTAWGQGIVETKYDNPFQDADLLEELGILDAESDDGGRMFCVQARFGLHEGAIWQMFNDMMGIAEALPPEQRAKLPDRIQDRLALLEG